MGAHSSHHDSLNRNRPTSFRRSPSMRHSKSKHQRSGKSSSPRAMDKLRRSFRNSFRRRREPRTNISEVEKPQIWQTDEKDVRSGTCYFHVKYLGCVEVFESRGMQVCEEAFRVLKNSRRHPLKAMLHVSGDGLRVVEDDTKGLIVDQTIEKVSFCAPDRTHTPGFSYICRDGTTRRWMCHGFLALKESGERLSHAVGCAFAVCLERKQKRDKECSVTMDFDLSNSTFTRTGSFRRQSLTEKLQDTVNPKNNIVSSWNTVANGTIPATIININNNINANYNRKENVPVTTTPKLHTHAIERPHATVSLLQRQGSFRGLSHLNDASPFKRHFSLKLSDLPSNAERTKSSSIQMIDSSTPSVQMISQPAVHPIPELSHVHHHNDNDAPLKTVSDQVSAMCQQLSQGLSFLSKNDDLIGSKIHQPLCVQDLFAHEETECSSQLLDLQPVVGVNSLFYVQSCSDNSEYDNNFLPMLQDSNLQSIYPNLVNNNLSRDADSSNYSQLSQQKYSTLSFLESDTLTPPVSPVPITNAPQLLKPEGKVAQLTSNVKKESLKTSAVTPSTSSPKWSPEPTNTDLSTQAYLLRSADKVISKVGGGGESFNIDWNSLTVELNSQSKSTNPFLSNNPGSGASDPAVKMYKVQM